MLIAVNTLQCQENSCFVSFVCFFLVDELPKIIYTQRPSNLDMVGRWEGVKDKGSIFLATTSSFHHPDSHYQDSTPKNGLTLGVGKCPHILRRNTPSPQLIFSALASRYWAMPILSRESWVQLKFFL